MPDELAPSASVIEKRIVAAESFGLLIAIPVLIAPRTSANTRPERTSFGAGNAASFIKALFCFKAPAAEPDVAGAVAPVLSGLVMDCLQWKIWHKGFGGPGAGGGSMLKS